MTIKKSFLVVPAYIAGIAATAAASQLLPQHIGLPIAAVLSIAMLSYFSMTHQIEQSNIEVHVVLWGLAFGVACWLAAILFNSIPGPMVTLKPEISWWQLAFVVAQQVFYFGIHAFTSDD
jgi:hypothetical protein